MAITINGTDITRVYFNGVRMETVNINGVESSRAANGAVTMVYTGAANGTFSPGVEDINRHFVVVGTRFSAESLALPATPTINGSAMTLITRGTSGVEDDGGISGIYTIKIPTGTGTFTLAQASTAFSQVAIYRVTGIVSMETALATGTTNGAINTTVTSSANGCFFGASVRNFGTAPDISPSSAGLTYSPGEKIAASNATTGPTQAISLGGNQINSYATFAYDLY